MPFKTITIKKEVYERIRKHKKRGESFSQLFERTFKSTHRDLLQFAGAWKDIPEKDFKEIKKRMSEFRSSFHEPEERYKNALSRL